MGWVTDFRSKYTGDIFFKTEFNVFTLQIIFAVVICAFVLISFNSIYKEIFQTLLTNIADSVKNNGNVSGAEIFDSIEIVKAKNFYLFFVVTVVITLIFSYVIARITLSPARNALKLQKRFISDIAHELRTPLSIIKANNEVALLDGRHGNFKNILKSNIEELDRASSIINNLLSFNNLIRPEQIQFVHVNMSDVVDIAIKKLEELIKNKEINLTVKKTAPYGVWGNATALEQVTVNIIKNAVNYNRPGGSVSVTLEPDYRGNVVLTVEDNGIGIARNDLNHIFEPFYRVDRSRSRQLGSTGLGLAIVSELVKLHSGRIRVASRLKEGTKITVLLPFSKNDPDEHSTNSKLENEVTMDYIKRR